MYDYCFMWRSKFVLKTFQLTPFKAVAVFINSPSKMFCHWRDRLKYKTLAVYNQKKLTWQLIESGTNIIKPKYLLKWIFSHVAEDTFGFIHRFQNSDHEMVHCMIMWLVNLFCPGSCFHNSALSSKMQFNIHVCCREEFDSCKIHHKNKISSTPRDVCHLVITFLNLRLKPTVLDRAR